MISNKINKSGLKLLNFQAKITKFSQGRTPLDPPNMNFLVQKDGVRDFTPEKVGNTALYIIIRNSSVSPGLLL